MRTPARVAKHPVHPMIVPIPIGLWIFSLVCDLVHRFGGASPNWEAVALYTMVGGIVGALIAAVPGFIDVVSLPSGALRRIGLTHMGLNLTIVVLYVINAWLRRGGISDGLIWLSVVSIVLLAVSGWLGGEMVYVRGVAVEPDTEVSGEGAARGRYQGADRRLGLGASNYFGPERRMALR